MANFINLEGAVITIDGQEFTAGDEVTVCFDPDGANDVELQERAPSPSYRIGSVTGTVSGTFRMFVQELDSAGKPVWRQR